MQKPITHLEIIHTTNYKTKDTKTSENIQQRSGFITHILS